MLVSVLATLGVVLLIAGFLLRRGRPWIARLWACHAAVVLLAFALLAGRAVWLGSRSPPEWDFTAFWLYGRVASERVNFYDPATLQDASARMELSPEFREEIVDVGAWYPPTSMLLFLPLGFLELDRAYVGWMLVSATLLLLDSWLLWSTFLRRDGWAGLLLVAAMLALWRPTLNTITLGQTNFLLLLLVLAAWRYAPKATSGVCLGLACLVKPVALVLMLAPILQRWTRVVLGAAAAIAAAVVLSLAVFGPQVFISYWSSPPTTRMPGWVYVEAVNQSLLATILRASHSPVPAEPSRQPAFLALAALLILVTVVVARRLSPSHQPLAWGLALSLGLLVYPATLAHYGLLLILPVCWLWSVRDEAAHGTAEAAVFAVLVSGLLNLSATFWAVALTWLWFVVRCLRVSRGENARSAVTQTVTGVLQP